jgi:hypothetical protein
MLPNKQLEHNWGRWMNMQRALGLTFVVKKYRSHLAEIDGEIWGGTKVWAGGTGTCCDLPSTREYIATNILFNYYF